MAGATDDPAAATTPPGTLWRRAVALHDRGFAAVERASAGWLPGLLARLLFAAVLFGYFFRSAQTKVEPGLAGLFSFTDGAYVQILPAVMEAASYDASQIAWFPWTPIVALGTWAEFVLPMLVVAGLMTRLAALGMIVFILVQSWVDIAFHGADAATVGAWFDRVPGSLVADQRALWLFLLLVLVLRGGGALSLDGLLRRLRTRD